jgi:hypothetical protein
MTVSTYPPALEMQANVPQMFDNDGGDQLVVVGRVRRPGTVTAVSFIPNWTMAGANTNSRTLNLYNRGTGGAGTTLVATLALTSGVDLTKYVAKTITVTVANAAVAIGDVLEWQSVHVGTGLPDPGGLVIVQFTAGS